MKNSQRQHCHTFPFTTVAYGVASFFLVAAQVQAQTLDSVVISASRDAQRSFDAAAAIQSVDRETIQDAGAQVNLSESLNRVPGLTILNRQNYAQDLQVSIRGFGARTAFGIRGVRLLIDGIPATTPDGQGQGSSISLPSTERIEVLRGPLAQLYGNSAGGVIQAFTREAPQTPEIGYQYYAGSYGMHRSDWQYAGKVGEVGVVADYATFDTNGYRDNSATQRKQFNGKLSFGPDEKTRVNLVFNQFDMPLAQDPIGLTKTTALASPQAQGGDDYKRLRKTVLQNQVGSSLVHALDADSSISARAYYGTRDNLQFQNGVPPTTATGGWVSLARSYYGAGLQYNTSLKLADVPLRLSTGYEFDRSREARQEGVALNGEKNTAVSLLRDEQNQAENSDFFAQATALLTDKYSLTGGFRQSTVRFFANDLLTNGAGSGDASFTNFSPVLGLTYHATETLNLFANYGRGFETPTLSELSYTISGNSLLSRFNPTVNASTSQHYEMGAKWLPSPMTRLDVNLYQVEASNEIVVALNTGGKSAYKNAPGTLRTGLELALSNLHTPQVSSLVSLSAIDATYTQSFCSTTVSPCTPSYNVVNKGSKLAGIPQHYLFAELTWSSQERSLSKASSRLGFKTGVELVSAGRLYANDANTDSADGYTVFNLKASHGWAVGKGLLTAYSRLDNVTNEKYIGSVIVNTNSTLKYFEPAPGVNYTVGLSLMLPI